MTLKLYYSPGACSLASHIALHEAGLAHTLARVNVKAHKLEDGTDFYTINPLGYVPFLALDDGRHLAEGAAILQYIADQAPEKNLAPANGTWERYTLQSHLNFIATEIHKNYTPLFKPGSTPEAKVQAVETLQNRYGHLNGLLQDRPYLLGEFFSVADAYLFTTLNWATLVQVDLSKWSHLQALRERTAARPAVQAALKAEGLLK